MYKLITVGIYFLFITACNSQKIVKDTTENQEFEQSNSQITLQQIIEQSNFKNPIITYNSNKSYVLCTDEFQGSRLASRIDFFIYDLKKNSLIEKGSIVGSVYWENDYTIALAPYVGMIQKKDHVPFDSKGNEISPSTIKKIYLEKQ